MTRKLFLLLSIILVAAGAASAAKIVITGPYRDGVKDNRIEVGSSQNVTLQYKNDSQDAIDISKLDISLSYDGDLIDQIENITGVSDKLGIATSDQNLKGSIVLSFASKNGTVRLGPGEVIDLAKISLHVNQLPKRVNYSTKLFSAVSRAPIKTDAVGEAAVPEALDIPDTFIEGAQAPVFLGISKITPVNQPGAVFYNIEWNPATDRTLPAYYSVYRRTKDQDLALLTGDILQNSAQDTTADQGVYYAYAVTARDSTTPDPNTTKPAPFDYIPIDITSPDEAKELKVEHKDDGTNRLTWKNPMDADLAGFAILVNYNEKIGKGRLEGARSKPPYAHGHEYLQWEEPFGAGEGYVRYISDMVSDPKYVPEEFIDDYTAPGVTFNYRVITYDLSTLSPPIKMGRNYSNGMDASVATPTGTGPSVSAPQITIWINDQLYQPTAGKDHYISDRLAKIKAEVAVEDPQDHDYSLLVDNARSEKFSDTKIEKGKAILETTLKGPFAVGKHVFTVQAVKRTLVAALAQAPVAVSAAVLVAGGPLRIVDIPLAFPSPWNPEKDGPVTIQYTLSNDPKTYIDIYIFSLSAEIVKKMTFIVGEAGALGQLNKVPWNGMTDQGQPIANGIYWVNIIDRDSATVLGKLKLTVYRGR